MVLICHNLMILVQTYLVNKVLHQHVPLYCKYGWLFVAKRFALVLTTDKRLEAR